MQFPIKIKYLILSVLFLLTHTEVLCQSDQIAFSRSNRTPWGQMQNQSEDWFTGEQAQQIAKQVMLYQRNSGGWPKNLNMAKPLTAAQTAILKKEKEAIDATIDNSTTFPQLRFLAQIYNFTKNENYLNSFLKGFDYLIESQYSNGGWPQFYPLRKGYYSHVTFNDDAMTGVLYLLRDVADKNADFLFVDEIRRQKAQQAVDKGLQIILKTQIKVNGKLTAWCAQYNEHSLEPADARTYELASISGKESVGVVEYLMSLDNPSPEVVNAIEASCRWFEESKITGHKVTWTLVSESPRKYNRLLVEDPNGGPLWARFYDIETNQPMYIDRYGIKKDSHNKLSDERRNGYAYVGDFARILLEKEYSEWKGRVVGGQ
ncbi:MAG: pectate lyase [Mariniphaga sp.]|nr:pectate lyase [Mariniphaga sp.]